MEVKITSETDGVRLQVEATGEDYLRMGENPFWSKEASKLTWFWLFQEKEPLEEMMYFLGLGVELFLEDKFKNIEQKVDYFASYVNVDNIPEAMFDIIQTVVRGKIIEVVKEG